MLSANCLYKNGQIQRDNLPKKFRKIVLQVRQKGFQQIVHNPFMPRSDIMDLRHQSCAMCIIMLGRRRHTPLVCNESREPHTSHYTSRPIAKKNNKQTESTSSKRKKLLYSSLILPILLYGSPVWCPTRTQLRQLENFQYKVIRWISKTSSLVSALIHLGILPICYQIVKNDAILLWKLCNNSVDLDNNIMNSNLCTRSSSNGLFYIPKSNKFSTNDNFYIRAARSANELINLKIVSFDMPLDIFKSCINRFLTDKTANCFNIDHSCSFYLKCLCSSAKWVPANCP